MEKEYLLQEGQEPQTPETEGQMPEAEGEGQTPEGQTEGSEEGLASTNITPSESTV